MHGPWQRHMAPVDELQRFRRYGVTGGSAKGWWFRLLRGAGFAINTLAPKEVMIRDDQPAAQGGSSA